MPYRSIPRRIKTDSDENVHVRRLGVQWQLTPESKSKAKEAPAEPESTAEPVENEAKAKPARKPKDSDD